MTMKAQRAILAVLIGLMILAAGAFTGCKSETTGLHDGYFTAEVKDFNHGWKEFLTICVKDGLIVSAEFQAKTASGFIKSWDMDYMRTMNKVDGTYPNEYVRVYTQELLETQNSDIDGLSGATNSHESFKLLAAAVIEQARNGDTDVAIVDASHEEN
jgi:major membrane immunogen (membrane-anchored lipoprotein)